MKSRGITTFSGSGELLPGRRVRVTGSDDEPSSSRGRHVVLASGSVPRTIPGFDVDGRLVLTSDEVLSLETAPASVAIIGGGAIGCEFASMFSDLGSQVTVLEALPSLLTGCDDDVVAVVARSFRKRGIAVHTGVKVTGHTPNGTGTTVVLRRRGVGRRSTPSSLSVGRRPLTEGLLADGTGVVVDDTRFRGGRRVHADGGRRGLGGRGRGRHAPAGPCRIRRGDRDRSRGSSASRSSRSTTPGSPGASTATPRWPSSG